MLTMDDVRKKIRDGVIEDNTLGFCKGIILYPYKIIETKTYYLVSFQEEEQLNSDAIIDIGIKIDKNTGNMSIEQILSFMFDENFENSIVEKF